MVLNDVLFSKYEFWYLSVLGGGGGGEGLVTGFSHCTIASLVYLHRHSSHHILYCWVGTLHALVCVYSLVFSFRKPFLTVHLPEGHAAMNVVRSVDERPRISLSYSLSLLMLHYSC